MSDEFMLPHELLDQAGVPDVFHADVAYRVQVAKYCALVEAVMKLTGGEPIEVDLRRVQEIHHQNPLTTDPAETVMVVERKPNGEPGPIIRVGLASPDEVRTANRQYALAQMGARRN